MKDFDAVVFDMDGVIFDSEKAVMDCWSELADKYGITGMDEVFYKCIGVNEAKTKEIVLEAYGQDFPYDEYAREASKLFHAKYDGGRLPMKSGVVEILEFFKKNNKKIALASSTKKESVVAELTDAKIIHYFDEIVTGDMVSKSKPEPDIFLLACEKIGVAPERAYAIEDSFNGIRAAAAGNLRPIMVPDILPADDEMRERAEVVLDSLEDVIKYLK
ncbi:HAD family hydrolase [Butyrivibrio proteoclasticus]|uniref:HAD family hydrolase n=1 Tax=Butyrivibrio proteoclasticus TaxID=43305 RepID=UPI00047E233D|nr:HAD family phosphatase [Butyrivibrio proteoclasticus]